MEKKLKKMTLKNGRLLVFQVPTRRRTQSGIYVGNERRGMFSRTEEVWICYKSPNTKMFWKTGVKGFVSDGFELESFPLSMWDDCKDLPEFSELRDFVESVDGEVETRICHENAILAIDDKEESGS